MVVVGHGVRERQQRGPLDAGTLPTTVVIRVRRYLCRACGRALTVVPAEVTARRHYSASAIALAVALFGVTGLAQSEVRQRVSPWRIVGATAATGWAALRRWIRAIKDGALFAGVRASPASFTLRQAAERAATTLAAYAPPAAATWLIERQAFAGAVAMA